MRNEIRQPYVLLIGLLLCLSAMAFALIWPEKGPLLYTVAIVTGMATKASVSMKMSAPNTAIGLFVLAVVTFAFALVIIGPEKVVGLLANAGLEATLSGLGGLGIALLGEAQVRSKGE